MTNESRVWMLETYSFSETYRSKVFCLSISEADVFKKVEVLRKTIGPKEGIKLTEWPLSIEGTFTYCSKRYFNHDGLESDSLGNPLPFQERKHLEGITEAFDAMQAALQTMQSEVEKLKKATEQTKG